jgi:hypothetical protein
MQEDHSLHPAGNHCHLGEQWAILVFVFEEYFKIPISFLTPDEQPGDEAEIAL